MMYNTGLVIGKFYPPHVGHGHLIEAAKKSCRNLYVLVQGSRFESISVVDRAEWIRQEFGSPSITVVAGYNECPQDYESDEIWDAQAESMRMALQEPLRRDDTYRINALFSSETYGERLAEYFQAEHVLVDLERGAFPVSGTACRTDLKGNWENLLPAARKSLAARVIVVGAESTGTTTLAEGLTAHYGIPPVSEYGRQYTYDKLEAMQLVVPEAKVTDLQWGPEDFRKISEKQTSMEEEAALQSNLVIADTDALATVLWEKFYTGRMTTMGNLRTLPRRDLYLITDDVGVPFEDDGWREGEHQRSDMTRQFKQLLQDEGHSWILVRGTHERRMKTAIEVIDQLLHQQSDFRSPVSASKTVLERV